MSYFSSTIDTEYIKYRMGENMVYLFKDILTPCGLFYYDHNNIFNVSLHFNHFFYICLVYLLVGGVLSAMVIVVGNRHSDTSANPGQSRLHFTLGKV